MNDDRDRILSSVRGASSGLKERAPYPEYADDVAVPSSCGSLADSDFAGRWQSFRARLEALHGHTLESVAELRELLLAREATHGYCDPALEESVGRHLSDAIAVSYRFERSRHAELQFGITRASGMIAESGTVVLTDAETSDRLGALSPWIHIAVVPKDRVFATLDEAIRALGDDPNVVWVTGPSKTADVEGVLIEGVHGPGEQVALLLV